LNLVEAVAVVWPRAVVLALVPVPVPVLVPVLVLVLLSPGGARTWLRDACNAGRTAACHPPRAL